MASDPHAASEERRVASLLAELEERTSALDAERRRLRAILDALPVGVFVSDATGRLVETNPAAQHIWGETPLVPAEQVGVYRGWDVHTGKRLASREWASVLAAMTGEPVPEQELDIEAFDGTHKAILNSGLPFRDAQGKLLGSVTVNVDITERRRAEQVRAQMDALVAAAPAAVALLDTSLRYVRVNDAMAASNGLPAEAHVGKTVREVRGAACADAERLLQQVLATGEPIRGVEFQAIPADDPGVVHTWLADYFPVRMESGAVVGVGGVVSDISEQKRTEEELRRTAEFRERFVGIVSHDLRTPLAAISAGVMFLLRMEGLPEGALRAARRISSSTERMARMIADLLDFTRGRLGSGIPIDRTPTDLRALVGAAVEEAGLAYPSRTVRLVAQGDCRGKWDAGRLGQVVTNLLKNALDYSPEGSPVDVTLAREADQVFLSVHNRNLYGPIPPESVPALFEPFHRGTHTEGAPAKGLGLGLYIAKEIVRAHGGTIDVASSEEGTRFTVRLTC